MWTCPTCGRIFQKTNQPHSCVKVPLEFHFKNKDKARKLFDFLLQKIKTNIGNYSIISLPCCIHLFGTYDFLAVLPKKDHIEVRFILNRIINSPRLKISVPQSQKVFKNCFDINNTRAINNEFIGWLKESYQLKSLS